MSLFTQQIVSSFAVIAVNISAIELKMATLGRSRVANSQFYDLLPHFVLVPLHLSLSGARAGRGSPLCERRNSMETES